MEFRNPPPTFTARNHLIGVDADSQPFSPEIRLG